MAKDTFCGCFHVFTAAVIMGVLQTVVLVILLSTSAVLLEHSRFWTMETDVDGFNAGEISTSTSQSLQEQTENISVWRSVGLMPFLEIHLAHHIAFYCLWLIFLAIFALAFKTYRPAMVIPNLIMQVIAVAIMTILAGILIAKLIYLQNDHHHARMTNIGNQGITETRYAFYSVLLGCLVVGLVAESVFMWINIEFYRFLRDMQHTVYPKSLQPNPTRRGLPEQESQHGQTGIEEGQKYPRSDVEE